MFAGARVGLAYVAGNLPHAHIRPSNTGRQRQTQTADKERARGGGNTHFALASSAFRDRPWNMERLQTTCVRRQPHPRIRALFEVRREEEIACSYTHTHIYGRSLLITSLTSRWAG